MRKDREKFIIAICAYILTMILTGCDIDKDDSGSNMLITEFTYNIVDTFQTAFYSDIAEVTEPNIGDAFYGQDGSYSGNQASYSDNGDGTVTDNVTGLIWQQDMGDKITFDEASEKATGLTLDGYDDWRIPTIKELYSLVKFDAKVMGETSVDLFIDDNYFTQPIGDTSIGEREIDAQTWSSTEYVGETMGGDATVFGVNFIDGRLKGYPKYLKATGEEKTAYFRLVRGNTEYGENSFVDNGDGTINDLATGLMWQATDSGEGMDWESALNYAENLELAGNSDWRLPNIKELQSILDYTRSLQTTSSAAIDPIFDISSIIDPEGALNYPYFWSGTTLIDGNSVNAAYFAFGEAQGDMGSGLMDVHGAGAQRTDPKSGDPSDYPDNFGPQGDVRYVYNYVRCVRN